MKSLINILDKCVTYFTEDDEHTHSLPGEDGAPRPGRLTPDSALSKGPTQGDPR